MSLPASPPFRLRARVLTPSSPGEVAWHEDALVVVDARGRIQSVTPYAGGDVDADLRDGVLTPGFVDAHIHYPQTRIVGAASGPLLDWLKASTFPEETRFAGLDHATAVAAMFCRALAAAGTTLSFVYGSVHPVAAEAMFTALSGAGLRAIAGPVLMDEGGPDDLMLPKDIAIPALRALAERWHGHDDRLQVAAIPRFGLSCSMDLMQAAGRVADKRGLWVSTHLSENPDECAATTARFGARDYLSVYEDAGLLHRRAVFAHCIHLSDSEWTRFADAGAVVAHCPDSNDFLGSGGMPLGEVQRRQIPMALGTDVAAGRTFRVPRVASSAHDNALRQGLRVSPATWLWHATRGGALALQEPQVGAIEADLQADLVWHAMPPWVSDAEGALAWLIHFHDAPPARATWVRGRLVWDGAKHAGGYAFVG